MTKVVAYVLVLALAFFVSANSVHGDESPTIYEQLDEAKEDAQEAVKKTVDSATGNEPQVEEQSKIAETTPSTEESKESKDSGETPSTEESKTPENTTSTEETKTSGSTAPAEDSKTSSSSWGQWVVNKLEHIGVISEKSKPGSSATTTEEAPAPGPSGDAPTPV